MADEWKYLPILKWKKGEQQALRELKKDQWQGVTPLIELQPIDAAPEGAALKAALSAYLSELAREIQDAIPEGGQVFVDTRLVSPGYVRQASLLVYICERLRRMVGSSICPVLPGELVDSLSGLSAGGKEAITKQAPLLLRLRTDQIEATQIMPLVKALAANGVRKKHVHLLIDQYSIVGRDPGDCAVLVRPYLVQADQASCASVTLGAGAFPMTLTGIKAGVKKITRTDWLSWKLVSQSGDFPLLRYADYTVTNPEPLPEIDPKTVNPSIAIRYATNGSWHLLKGKGFKGAPAGEYAGLCKLLVTDKSVYSGKDFSFGDGKYFASANGVGKNGTPWTWRREATNHHIVFTAKSL